MYLTIKKIYGQHYLYIKECTRKNSAKAPFTRTIKFIGNAKKYSNEDVDFIRELLRDKTENIMDFIEDLKKDNKSRRPKRTNEKNTKKKQDKCIICGFDIVTQLHHRIPVSEGGSHDEENLICLCPNHHQMAHMGLIDEEEI